MTETQHTEDEPSPAVAVVGVGNEIMADDGIGPHVVRRLEETPIGESDAVRLVNAGTTGFLALEALSGCEHALVIDAMQTGAAPGTIHEFRCVEGTFEGDVPDMTMHDISFTEALAYGRGVYDLPDEIRVLGVEPAAIEPAVEVSDELDETIPDIIETTRMHITRLLEGSPVDHSNTEESAQRPRDDRSTAHSQEGET